MEVGGAQRERGSSSWVTEWQGSGKELPSLRHTDWASVFKRVQVAETTPPWQYKWIYITKWMSALAEIQQFLNKGTWVQWRLPQNPNKKQLRALQVVVGGCLDMLSGSTQIHMLSLPHLLSINPCVRACFMVQWAATADWTDGLYRHSGLRCVMCTIVPV